MKDLLDKFNLNEFLAYISPGVVIILSIGIWYSPILNDSFWNQELLLLSIGLIVSYTLGWIVASYNLMAFVRYLRTSGIRERRLPVRILTGLTRAIFVFSSPRINPPIVKANLKIEEGLEKISREIGLPVLADPNVLPADRAVAFRNFVSGRVGQIGEGVILQADYYHKRFLFSIGMAVALLIFSIQMVLRLVVDFYNAISSMSQLMSLVNCWNNECPSMVPDWFIAPHGAIIISVVGVWVSFELRQVAFRMWELERYLTASLVSYSETYR